MIETTTFTEQFYFIVVLGVFSSKCPVEIIIAPSEKNSLC
jgi:hypothetical protein